MLFEAREFWESMIVAMEYAKMTTSVCCWGEMAALVCVEQTPAVLLKTPLSAAVVDLK
jgi:homoserine trans-succinylase